MAVQQKIRIYDLAKELKLDNKKILDDARREGVDVSVPSNTLPMEVAERIRTKYYPKKIAPSAGPRLVKTVKPVHAEEQLEGGAGFESPAADAAQPVPMQLEAPGIEAASSAQRPEVVKPKVLKLKPSPQPQPEAPASVAPVQPPSQEAAIDEETSAPAEAMPAPRTGAVPEVPDARPRSQVQVRVLRPQPGARPSAPPSTRPIAPGGARPFERARVGGAGPAEAGAPAPVKPRTVYVPEPESGRPRRRTRRGKQGGFGHEEGKHADPSRHGRASAAPAPAKVKPVFTELRALRLVEGATVKDFSEKIEAKPKDVVQQMLQKGVMATINQTLNPEIAIEIGRDFGYEISFVPFEEMISSTEEEKIIESGEEGTCARAPVVTVMGHVDHGKTSLLDAIRKTRVAEGEAGGITQHIGAYSVEVPDPDDHSVNRTIVFLDTPGHEAFTTMRARGARVTDIVVLVVAADDGVMPQTLEAIDHARAAEVPIIVAINKVDKPDAQPDRVKQELSDRGLLWDGWGGDTVMVEVSAKKLQNIDQLLEMIILTADLQELKANPDRLAAGVVLEAKLDRGRGPVATVLVQQGRLKVGDPFIVGQVFGRVRAMLDDRGRSVEDATPSTPVEVLGLQGVPQAGDPFQVAGDAGQAQHIAAQRQMQARQAAIARTSARSLEQLFSGQDQIKELLVILKADVAGSVEAVRDVLNRLSTGKVKIRIIRSGVGAITESDVMLAAASSKDMNRAAVIIGFNVRPESRAREIAEIEGIDMRLHTIIYKVEEEIRNAMLGLLEATKREVVTGRAEVRQVFKIPKVGVIAGCYVVDGTMKRTAARVLRDNIVIHEGRIESLRRFKEDVSEVKPGFECGIGLERFQDIKAGDFIEAFITEEVAPTQL